MFLCRMENFFILKVYSDHIKIYIKNRNQKLTQMTYYCIGSESDAVIWKEEERRERERERVREREEYSRS